MNEQRLRNLTLLSPAVLFLAAFILAPLLLMLYVSVLERGPFGGVVWGSHTGIAYQKLLYERDLLGRLSFNSDYIAIFARSCRLAAMTTLM